ncbi:hypothetical protein NCTC2275_04658 [Mycobacterium marinum]|nr:hypothetical protein NCTC2275_04658 [Mycobacterium marinum]
MGAATAVLAVLIAEPIFAKSDAAAVTISGATNTNAIAALQARNKSVKSAGVYGKG